MRRVYYYDETGAWPKGHKRLRVAVWLAWRLGLKNRAGKIEVSTEPEARWQSIILYEHPVNPHVLLSSSSNVGWCKKGLRQVGLKPVPRTLWYRELG